MTAFLPPTDHPALQWFLGMLNFYRKFINVAALILYPLTDALRGDPKDLSWSPQMDSVFISAKSALEQLVQGFWAPLTFYSKKLSFAETHYSAFD